MKIEFQRAGLTLRGVLEGTNTKHVDKVAIIMHGFKADLNSSLTTAVAKTLNEAGIPTLRFNFAGSGDSDGDFSDMTVFSEILDAIKAIEYARQELGAKEIFLIGHSQGGVVASMVAAYYHDLVAKLVLLSPAATLKDDALKGVCQGSTYDPMHIPATVNVQGHMVSGAYFRTAQLMPIYETAQHYDGPTLIIAGDKDQIVDPATSQKYNTIMPDSTFYLLDGAAHDLSGDSNQRQQALDTVKQFITKQD